MTLRSTAALAAVFSVGLAASAKADVHWLVSGTFDDGGTFSGGFDTDVYGFVITSTYDVVTTGGLLTPYDYNAGDSYTNSGNNYVEAQPGYAQDLKLTFTYDLTVGSQNNPLVGGPSGPSFECQGSYSCYLGNVEGTRYVASGAAAAVPEVSTWGMMLLGCAGLGYSAFRRSARVPVSLA